MLDEERNLEVCRVGTVGSGRMVWWFCVVLVETNAWRRGEWGFWRSHELMVFSLNSVEEEKR